MKRQLFLALAAATLPGIAAAQRVPPPPPPPPTPAMLQGDLNARAGSDTVFFSAQGYGLSAPALATLRAQAEWLRANPFVSIRRDGHGDRSDTRDYALAIGERRASAVRDYLISQGVLPHRITVASWGKERPGIIRVGANFVGVGPRVVTLVR